MDHRISSTRIEIGLRSPLKTPNLHHLERYHYGKSRVRDKTTNRSPGPCSHHHAPPRVQLYSTVIPSILRSLFLKMWGSCQIWGDEPDIANKTNPFSQTLDLERKASL